jgi:hypothetical protein
VIYLFALDLLSSHYCSCKLIQQRVRRLLLDLGREGVLLVDCEKSHRFSFGLNLCLFVSFSSDRFLTLAFVRFECIVVRSPVLFLAFQKSVLSS